MALRESSLAVGADISVTPFRVFYSFFDSEVPLRFHPAIPFHLRAFSRTFVPVVQRQRNARSSPGCRYVGASTALECTKATDPSQTFHHDA